MAGPRGRWKVSGYAVMVPLDRAQGIVYHTATRHLLLVRGELWNNLRQLSLGDRGSVFRAVALSATKDEWELLRAHHIIVPSAEDERPFARYIINSIKFSSVQMGIYISLTSRCNFACNYCYQDFRKGRAPSDLTPKRWKSLFGFIVKHVGEVGVKRLVVTLYGGEPLLALDTALRVCHDLKSLESNNCRVQITLITNGSLLFPVVWRDLKPYVELVQVTIDGNREIHDRSRPFADGRGSYDVILENISTLVEQSPGRLAIRVNVQPNTLPGVRELLTTLDTMRMQSALAAIDFHTVEPTQQQICAGVCNSTQIQMASEISELFVTAASMGFPCARSFEIGPCMYTVSEGLVVDEQLRLYKCPALLLYWRSAGRVNVQGRAELGWEWYESVSYEPRCALSCKYGPICYGGCRAMTSSWKRIQCQKPFFNAALENLIKAYVIARHKIGLAGKRDEGVTAGLGGEENDGVPVPS